MRKERSRDSLNPGTSEAMMALRTRPLARKF
jgi:hypothetical protein